MDLFFYCYCLIQSNTHMNKDKIVKNISVPLKLAIGIGLILLLSVMLAVNSFYSLNILTMRTTNIDKITQIDANVDALRIISAQYKATLNENYITEAQLLADQVRQNANEAKTTLTAASNHKAMDEIQADVTEYGQSFANYIQAQQAIETSIAINRQSALIVRLSVETALTTISCAAALLIVPFVAWAISLSVKGIINRPHSLFIIFIILFL